MTDGRGDVVDDGGLPERARENPTFSTRYDVSTWRLIGEGAHAIVGEIFCRDEAEPRAVKIFKSKVPEERLDRVRDEVRNARQVQDPHILRIHSIYFTPRLDWIEMERVVGPTLKEVLKETRGPLPFKRARSIAEALLMGLEAAHAAGVVHRDIKPENLVLPESGTPPLKLLDFGISRAGEAVKLSATAFPGTPFYAPPEAYLHLSLGPSADVYSAALVLYEVFTGRYAWALPPGWDDNPPAIQLAMLSRIHTREVGEPLRARQLVDGPFPPELDEMLFRALAKEPSRRPTATDILAILRRVPDDPKDWISPARPYLDAPLEPAKAAPPPAPPPPVSTPASASARPMLTRLAILAAVVILAVIAPRLLRNGTPPAAVDDSRRSALGSRPLSTPLATPALNPTHFRATLDSESLILTNTASEPATAIAVEILGIASRATSSATLSPGASVLFWPSRFTPPLPASPAPTQIKVTAQVGGQHIEEIVPVQTQ